MLNHNFYSDGKPSVSSLRCMASKFLTTEQAVAKYFQRSLHDDADCESLQQSASSQKNRKEVFWYSNILQRVT